MPHKYKPYSKYKDSGIEWSQSAPEKWKLSKLKYDSYIKARVGWHGLKSDEFTDEGPYLVTGSDFSGEEINWSNCYHCDMIRYDQDPYIQLQNDDLLITKDGTIGKVILTGKLPDKATLNSGVFVLRPLKQAYTTKFYYWLMQSSVFHNFVEYSRAGSTIAHLYQETFCNIRYALPELTEQRAIAAFLDHETGKIDKLIEKQQKLIELLEEKRQAVISHAVTKGLNPDVPMKDSGIEWLGDIPEHWKESSLKWYCHITDGSHHSPKIKSSGEPFVSVTDVGVNTINFKDCKRISLIDYKNLVNQGCKPEVGDVLLTKDGTIGRAAIVQGSHPDFVILSSLGLLSPSEEILNTYLYYFLISGINVDQMNSLIHGSALKRMTINKIENLLFIFPPLSEQQSIVTFLNTATNKIDKLISKAKSAIELMRERRTALISAAVTGKIDVRDFKMVTEQKNIKANIHFKRSVLAAEIAERMQHQNKFGRIKFQKILVLCDLHLDMDIGGNYQRDAAGPFDNRMMRSITSQLAKQKWFKPVKPQDGYGTKYVPMEKAGGHQEYFYKYWGDKLDKFNELFALLEPMTTEQAEIVATLYSAWHDFLEQGKLPTDEELVTEVRTNWHESKERIEPARWYKAINWMRQKKLCPIQGEA